MKSKFLFRATSLVLVLLISLSTVVFAITTILWPDELTGFEKYNSVYTEFVVLETAFEETTLPESVRGFVSIPDDMDVNTFVQVEPSIDSSTGTDYYDYYDYGYVRPSNSVESYENNELVIYSIFYADEDGTVGEIGYRVYGYLEGSTTVWFTCDIDGNITGAILDVPVDWVGEYDAYTYGTYTFSAVISADSSYTYNGEMPTAEIVVYNPDDVDCGHGDDCDCATDILTASHIETAVAEENYDNSISVMSVDDGISTMALTDDYNENTYGYNADGSLIAMRDLISEYVTENIPTSGNADFTTVNGVAIPGSWVDYLNTIWNNVVGATVDGSDWESSVSWIDTTDKEMQELYGIDTDIMAAWTGTGDGNTVDSFIYESTKEVANGTTENGFYSKSENTWKIYTGEQLLYALIHYNSGDTIILQRDIDLNGQYYNWPGVTLTKSVTIDGNYKTIYNLGSFIEYSSSDVNEYGSISSLNTCGGFVEFYGTGQTFVVKNLSFQTGKLYADTNISTTDATSSTNTNLALFMIDERWGAYDFTVEFDNVSANEYLVCSQGSSNAVLLSMYETDGAYITTEDTSTYDYNYDFDNCSVSNSYVYGNNHVGTIGTYTSNASFTNCYSVGNTLVGTGFHSGAFVSCLNSSAYFESCFAADNYLYSATQSGGFVGYGGDCADYVNCYSSGIVEGYSYLGGFVGATSTGHDYIEDTTYSRNYNTFTNCYSTTLVGMRTETQDSGGFVGIVYYAENNNPTSATVFTDCYAAGEVGSTQTVTESNTNFVGGFVGYDQTYNENNTNPYQTDYTNCYYDKQTTAMREWVSGRYNSTDEDNIYTIAITGVLTSDSDKYGTGLISEPSSYEVTVEVDGVEKTFDEGFKGFTNASDWVYTTDEHYPELSVFANASSSEWSNPELVQAYSLASTATVILDTWDYGYTWDSTTGIRSDSKELYYGSYTYDDGLDDHIADRYTYDTVREVVSNAAITDTAVFTEMVEGGILTQSYMYDDIEYDEDKNITNKDELKESKYNDIKAFNLDNATDSLTVTAPGIDWYDIEEDYESETGSRPIRLISFMNVDAGEDQVLTASDLYDHRDDAYFTMIDTIKQNMIVALDSAETWSTSVMQIYPDDEAFHEVDTLATNFTASDSAWINTEIWRAEAVSWTLTDDDFEYDVETDTYYYIEEGIRHEFYIGQDGVIYYMNADGTQSELYASEIAEDGSVSYYTADYSVKVYGTDDEDDDATNVTTAKWNGLIPLYPDIGETQYYIVRYYWVLGNGRYRSDYKIIEIGDEEIDVSVSHDVTINVYNDDATEDTSATPNGDVMAVNADGYEGYTSEDPVFDDETSSIATTANATATYDSNGDLIQNVAYGENSYVSWVKEDENSMVTKTVLTMTSNGGYEVGSVETVGELAKGDTITIPIETFYLDYIYDTDGTTITGQTTMSKTIDVTYIVQEDETTGGLYLEFDNYITDDVDNTDVIFDDTSYNITFDIYVQEASKITVTKVIENYDEDIDDGMDEQSFVINLTGDVKTDVVLTHDETSNPIYVVLGSDETNTFYVDETVPMEFALTDISYTVNSGDETEYTSDGIKVSQGDVIEIIVTNTFTEESYFKSRDEVNNEFTYTE